MAVLNTVIVFIPASLSSLTMGPEGEAATLVQAYTCSPELGRQNKKKTLQFESQLVFIRGRTTKPRKTTQERKGRERKHGKGTEHGKT